MHIYNPFQYFDFQFDKCFITGRDASVQKPVIHPFLQESGGLSHQTIKMLDEQNLAYQKLVLPCNQQVYESSILSLENQVIDALKIGFEEVNQMDRNSIFLWGGLVSYGFIYNELHSVTKLAKTNPEAAQIPQGLIHKFKNLHLMLQKIILPVAFDGFTPYSMAIFPLNEKVPFSFRNDMNSLTFSMKINDLGLVIVLQDNAYTIQYLHKTLEKVKKEALSLLQFEEICAQFYYASYLMNKLPEYDVLKTPETLFIDARPLAGLGNKLVFDIWQQKVYAQVLESFWKPWGYTMFEILKNPEKPLSFI